MGDLISRSALIEEIDTQLNEIKETEGMTTYVILLTSICEKFKKLIKRIPTAYSVDKVVAELEENCDIYSVRYYLENIEVEAVPIGDAIDIVKRGGVE